MREAESLHALRELCFAFALLTAGLAFAFGLHLGLLPGIELSVALSVAVLAWGAVRVRTSPGALLPRFMLVVYALPFSVLLGYLGNPEFQWVFTSKGYLVAQDRLVMQILAVTGLVGSFGIVAGLHLANARSAVAKPREVTIGNTAALGTPAFAIALVAAVALSWLSSPPETILQAQYSLQQSEAASRTVNFPAAFLVSYVLFIMLWVDAEREMDAARRQLKRVILAIAITYVIAVLQVLRGDRESSGLIVALAALYVTRPLTSARAWPSAALVRQRMRRLLPAVALAAAIYIALGEARGRFKEAVSTLTPVQMVKLGWSQNTWTGVLWRNLGVAWEYRNGLVDYKWGATYRDYVLSLPPGFITQAVGYERRVEAWRGISWEDPAGVSSGGLHVVIPPFKNFGAPGVLGVMCLIGLGIGALDRAGWSGRFLVRILWGAVFASGFLWFWYGDMTLIRGVLAAFIVFFCYRLALSLPSLSDERHVLLAARSKA